jgi:hypothetical protein
MVSCSPSIHVSCLLCTVHKLLPLFSLVINGGLSIWVARRRQEQKVTSPFDSSTAVSRASALALSAVLRTTSLCYGNMPFSGTHPTKTP